MEESCNKHCDGFLHIHLSFLFNISGILNSFLEGCHWRGVFIQLSRKTPRFFFSARRVTETPSSWRQHQNYFFRRVLFPNLSLAHWILGALMLSSHPNPEYFGDLEANLSYFLSSEQPMGSAFTGHQEMQHGSTSLSERYGQRENQKVPTLTARRTASCSRGRQGRPDAPCNEGGWV